MATIIDATVTQRPYIQWGPVIAGAIAASAISFLLLTFGGAIGLSLTSPWPYEGVRASNIAIAIGIWTALVQIFAFAAGGYLAGRFRSGWETGNPDESQFRDGAHGFMVWAVGIVFGALLLAFAGGSGLKTAVQSASTIAAGATGGATARGPELLASAEYASDLLLRPALSPQTGPSGTPAATLAPARAADNAGTDAAAQRADISRIFTRAIAARELSARDRDYLASVVMARTGLPQADAEKRVSEAVQEAQQLEIRAREATDKARKTAILAGFLAAASVLIGLGASVAGASLGGRQRDENIAPRMFGRRFW
jgi:hypothetical protein